MFYFMICSYSKLEETKNGFVKHWSEKHRDYYHQQSKCKEDKKVPTTIHIDREQYLAYR